METNEINGQTHVAKKPGRPRMQKSHQLSHTFAARVTAHESQQIHQAIDASGQPKSRWLRSALVNAAK